MRIKILLGLILPGMLSFNILLAKAPEGDNNRKSQSASLQSDTPKPDSTKIGQDEGTVNLPFTKAYRRTTAGAITVINPDEILKYDGVQDVYDIIGGIIPGSFGGIDVRGLGDALIVVDGIPRPISTVRAEEIEQITVLKDVNSAIMYGVQGNNGIILITTKRGQANNRKVNFSIEQGFSKPVSLPTYLGSAEYKTLYNEARLNDGLTKLYDSTEIARTLAGNNPAKYPDADYYSSEFLKNVRPSTRIVGQFSGGNNNAQYYLSAGWQHTGTILNMGEAANDRNERLNLRSNVNFRITDWIKSYVDVMAIWDIQRRANGNFWSDASTLLPNQYTPLIDTALIMDKQYKSTAKIIKGHYMIGGRTGYTNNIYANMTVGGYYSQVNTSVQFNNGIDVDLSRITKGLTLKTFIGFDFYNQFRETQSNTYAVYQPVFLNKVNGEDSVLSKVTKIGVDKFDGTQGLANSLLQRNLGVYGMLDYSRVFGKHDISATMVAYAENYVQTDVLQPDKNAQLSFRLNYILSNKYIVDFSSALVNSTKLHPDHKIGFAPSVALGWILSEESFLKNNSFIDFLKLKFSTGSLLTDRTIPGYYYYEGVYVSGSSFSWDDAVRTLNASSLSIEKNYNLFYQRRNEINGGIEAVTLNNSLWLDANVFKEVNTDLVTRRVNSYPEFLGSFYPYENYGEQKTTGFELGATWRQPSTSDLSFEIGANMIYAKSELVKTDEKWDNSYQYRAGKPLSSMFGLESLGLFKDSADIANSTPQSFGTVKPGDIKYKDQNGDNVIDSRDEIMIGQSSPTFAGGLNLKIKYKNFSVYALATGRTGGQRYFNNAYYWVYSDRKYSDVVLDRWTPSNPDAAYPRLTSQSNSNNFRSSTFWLEENKSITFDRLQFNYDVPSSFSSKLYMKDLSLYFRASDIATFAKNARKMDLNIGSEPQYRYFAIGLRSTF